MASPVGGRFKFTNGFLNSTHPNVGVHVGISSKLTSTVSGALNIEAFKNTIGTRTNGYIQSVAVSDTVKGDSQPTLNPLTGTNQLLTGRRLTLFGGNYKVTDTNTVTGNTALIIAGSGAQTVIGAKSDTLVGGTGTGQLLSATLGHESVIGGTKTYTVTGGIADTIKASGFSTSITAGHITATASSEHVQIGGKGHYTVTAGSFSTVTSAVGNAGARITAVNSDRIDLTGNTGSVSVVGQLNDTVIAGRGLETLKGGAGDRFGVGSGNTVGGTLQMSHATTAAGAIAFGTNDTVNSTTYNTKTHVATRGTKLGTSSAHVTVTNFRLGTDTLFYKGETATLNKDIVLTAHNVTGGVQIVLPDGTTMTLLGHTASQLVTQNGNTLHPLFKL